MSQPRGNQAGREDRGSGHSASAAAHGGLGVPSRWEGGGVDTECQFRVSRCGTESDGTEQNRKARVKVLGLEV